MCINLWKTVSSEIDVSFLHACFSEILETIALKRLLLKNFFKKKLSILHRLRFKQIYGEDFIFKKNFDVLITTVAI